MLNFNKKYRVSHFLRRLFCAVCMSFCTSGFLWALSTETISSDCGDLGWRRDSDSIVVTVTPASAGNIYTVDSLDIRTGSGYSSTINLQGNTLIIKSLKKVSEDSDSCYLNLTVEGPGTIIIQDASALNNDSNNKIVFNNGVSAVLPSSSGGSGNLGTITTDDTSDIESSGTATWTGSSGVTWTNEDNWSPKGVPDENSNVLIPSGVSNKPQIKDDVTVKSIIAYSQITIGVSDTEKNITLALSSPSAFSSILVNRKNTLTIDAGANSVSVDTLQLASVYNSSSSTGLSVEASTKLRINTLTAKDSSNNISSGNDSVITINSITEISSTNYDSINTNGSGKIYINSASLKKNAQIWNTCSNLYLKDVTIEGKFGGEGTVHVIGNTSLGYIPGGDDDKFPDFYFEKSGASLTITKTTETSTLNKVEISENATIKGAFTCTDFTAKDLGGKTLTFGSADTNVSVTGDMVLTGTSSDSLLKITGTSGAKITLSSSQETGKFLDVETVTIGSSPYTNKYTAKSSHGPNYDPDSHPTGDAVDGWVFTNDKETKFVWTGSADTDWEKAGNWDVGVKPYTDGTSEITIPNGCDNYPVLSGAINVYSLSIGASDTATATKKPSLDINNQDVTVAESYSNYGTVKIQHTSAQKITFSKACEDNGTWIFEQNSGSNTHFDAIKNLKYNYVELYPDGSKQFYSKGKIDAAQITIKQESSNGIVLDNNGANSNTTTWNGKVILEAAVKFITKSSTYNQTMVFNSTVTGGYALSVEAASGNASCGVIFNDDVSVASVTANVPATIKGDITTSGAQTYSYAVTLGNDVNLTGVTAAAPSTVTFGSTVDGAFGLTVGSSTIKTNAVISGVVGVTNPLKSISVSGTASLGANVTVSGDGASQTYTGAVTLTGDVVLTAPQTDSTIKNIIFGDKINSDASDYWDLTINCNKVETKSIGNSKALKNLTVSGAFDLGDNTPYKLNCTGDIVIQKSAAQTTEVTDSKNLAVIRATVSAASVTVSGGITVFGQNSTGVITSGNQTYDAVKINSKNNDGHLFLGTTDGNTKITINGDFNSNASTERTAVFGASGCNVTVDFKKAVGNITAQKLKALTVYGNATFGGNVTLNGTDSTLTVSGSSSFKGKVTTSGAQTYSGAVTLAGDSSFDAGTADVSATGGITSSAKTLSVTCGTATFGNNTTPTAAFADAAELTLTGNAVIYGANKFTSLTIDNSTATAATSVKFEGGQLQKIGTIFAKGNATNKLTLASTDGTGEAKWKVYFVNDPAASAFEYTEIKYSQSVESDGSAAKELGITPDAEKIVDAIPDGPSAISWFAHKYYWIGGSDSLWSNAENWAYDDSGNLKAPVPSVSDGLSEIVIARRGNGTDSFDLDLGDGVDLGAGAVTTLSIKSLLVEHNSTGTDIDSSNDYRICLGSCKISAADTITINGVAATYGNTASPLTATNGITWGDSSTIEYCGSKTAKDELFVSVSGDTKTYKNLYLAMSAGASLTFESKVNAAGFGTNQAASSEYNVYFNKDVSIEGASLICKNEKTRVLIGRQDVSEDTYLDDGLKVHLKGSSFTVTSAEKLLFGCDLYLENTSITIEDSAADSVVFIKRNVIPKVSDVELNVKAKDKIDYRGILDDSVKLLKKLTVTGKLFVKDTTKPIYNSCSLKTKGISVSEETKNIGAVICVDGDATFTGPYSGKGSLTASSATTTFGGNVDLSSGTFVSNGGTVVFDGGNATLITKNDGSTTFNNVTINTGKKVTCATNFVVAGNWTNSGTFTGTSGTITFTKAGTILPALADPLTISGDNSFGNVNITGADGVTEISGDNTFTSLSVTGNGATVKFGADKTQEIGTLSAKSSGAAQITLTTDSASPGINDVATWWKVKFTNAPSNSDFEKAAVEYAKVISDPLTLIADSASILEKTDASTDGWFTRTYYWFGKDSTDATSWLKPANWSTKDTYFACTVSPASTGGKTIVVIKANDSGILKLTSGISIQSITVEDGKSVDFGGQAVNADTITNNGTIRLTGAEVIKNSAGTGDATLSNKDGSTIEYYGGSAGSANKSLSWGNSYQNLLLSGVNDFNAASAITVDGNLSVTGATTLGKTSVTGNLSSTAALSSSEKISVTGTSTFNTTADITLSNNDNAFTGDVTVTKAGAVSLNGKTSISLAADANCESLTAGASDNAFTTINLKGNVTTTGAQTYYGGAVLKDDCQFVAGNDTVTFSGTVDSDATARALTIGDGSDVTSASFGGVVGGTKALGAVSVGGNATFGAAVSSSSLSVTGTTAINGGSVTTTDAQTYSGAVSLGAATSLDSGTADISAPSGITSSSNTLSLTCGTATLGDVSNKAFADTAYVTVIGSAVVYGDNTITSFAASKDSAAITLKGKNTITTFTASGTGQNITFENANSFDTLSVKGKGTTVTLPAGDGNTQTVSTKLELEGTSADEADKLTLKSATADSQAYIAFTGTIVTGATPNPSVKYAVLKDMYNGSVYALSNPAYITTISCTDNGNNDFWNFPGATYTWKGGDSSSSWNTKANWENNSVPGNDTIVVINTTAGNKNPVLTSTNKIEPVVFRGLTVNAGKSLDLAGEKLTVSCTDGKKITNNGTIRLTGAESITKDGTAAATLENGTESTIEYYGDATTKASWGTEYNNLLISGKATIETELNVAGTTKINADATDDVTLSSASNTFTGDVTVTKAGAVSLNSDGSLKLNAADCSSLSVTGAASASGRITTTGGQTYNGALTAAGTFTSSGTGIAFKNTVTLSDAVTISASGLSVAFENTVNGAKALSVTGNTTFAEAVGGTARLASVSVSGTAAINGGAVSTSGAQSYNEDVTLGADTVLLGGKETVTFGGKLDSVSTGEKSLTVGSDSEATEVSFGGLVGRDKPLSSITLFGAASGTASCTSVKTSGAQTYNGTLSLSATETELTASTVTFGKAVTSKNLIVNGVTVINGQTVTSDGNQTYKGNVTLGADTVLAAGNNTVYFEGLVNSVSTGEKALSIGNDTDTTSASFGGVVGGLKALSSISVKGAVTGKAACTSITSSGSQSYSGDVSFAAPSMTVTGSKITYGGKLTSNDLKNSGDAEFDGTASVTGNLEVTGETEHKGETVTSTGTQKYTRAVTLSEDTTLLAGENAVTFGGTVDSGATGEKFLAIGNGSNTTSASFGGVVGGTKALSSLSVTGSTTGETGCSAIKSSGAQTYKGAVTFNAASITVTASTGVFESTLTSNVIKNVGNAEFKGEVNVTGTLEVTGTTLLKAVTVQSTSSQTYDGEVTLGSENLVSGTEILFKKPVNGTENLTVNASSSLTFSDLAGNTTALGALKATGAGKTYFAKNVKAASIQISAETEGGADAAEIETSGIQTYSGAAEFKAASVNLSGTVITFGNTLTAKKAIVSGKGVFQGEVSCNGTFEVTGTAALNGGKVTSTESQTYNDAVTLGVDNQLSGSEVLFKSTVTGSDYKFTVTSTEEDIAFEGDVSVAEAVLTSKGKILLSTGKTFQAAESISMKNSGIAILEAGSALKASGNITQTGGQVQLACAVSSTSGKVSFENNVFVNGASSFTAASGIFFQKNLFLYAKDSSVSFNSASSVQNNFVLFNGNAAFAEGINFTVGDDLVLLNGTQSSMDNDADSGVEHLFAYHNPARAAAPSNVSRGIGGAAGSGNTNSSVSTAAPSLAAYPEMLPDGTAMQTGASAVFKSTVTGLKGQTFTVKQNFYDNGVELAGAGEWTLQIPDNNNSNDSFAEIYNAGISNCKVVSLASGGYSVLAAAEAQDDGNNTNVFFSRPVVLVNDTAKSKLAEKSGSYTVYDDVLRVEFADSLSGQLIGIENSNNEISAAMKRISGGGIVYTSFTDSECTVSTDGAGDISAFYLKASRTWNTDATGSSACDSRSYDFSGNHSTAVPYLDVPKAVSGLWATIQDEHKNRISHCSGEGKRIVSIADRCSPVLVAVRTGQELHDSNAASQMEFDSHNFIEYEYSEAVSIAGLDAAATNTASTAALGGITNKVNDGFTVAGLSEFAAGKVKTFVEGTENTVEVHSLYRKFAVSAADAKAGTFAGQSHRVRVGIASFSDKTVSAGGKTYRHWKAYIDGAEAPSGTVTRLQNDGITDGSGNLLCWQSPDQSHGLPLLSVNSEDTELFGKWDTVAPKFAAYINYAGENKDSASEISGVHTEGLTYLSAMEFHVWDNGYEIGSEPENRWFTQAGWQTEDHQWAASNSYAADIFGGARQFDSDLNRRTGGGVRYSTLYNKSDFFKYSTGIKKDVTTKSFDSSTITAGATSSMFFPADVSSSLKNGTGAEDGLYFAVKFQADSNHPLKETFTVSFDESAYVTDLAGNLLHSEKINTIDSVNPKFEITVAELNGQQLYVLFNKKIQTENIEITLDDGTVVNQNTDASLRFVTIGGDGKAVPESDLVLTQNRVVFSNDHFTGILYDLSAPITMYQLQNYYLQCYAPAKGHDPATGVPHVDVTFIQGVEKGADATFMPHGEAHALSDFAVGAVDVAYAYDNRLSDTDGAAFAYDIFKEGSAAVHDWNEEQKNYGTLHPGYDITMDASVYSDESGAVETSSVTMFMDNTPDANSVSTEYNDDITDKGSFDVNIMPWRIWLPVSMSVLSKDFNRNYYQQNVEVEEGKLPVEIKAENVTDWVSGNQISFLFGLNDSAGNSIKICRSPVYNPETAVYEAEKNDNLFALRLKTPGDLTSLDLWSFRLQSMKTQRGGVTIANNVINASEGEKAVLQIDMASEGNVNAMVMTLDGNIVQYLHHGKLSAGTHSFTWNGRTKSGKLCARGMYFIRVTGAGMDETRKVMVVKD